jgi:hypothetical protein
VISAADLTALRAKRCEAVRRVDELADLYDRFPKPEIRNERDMWARKVNAYDETLAEMST